MASLLKLFLCIVIVGFGAKYLGNCHPNVDSDWILEIKNYAIYLLVRESALPPGAAQAESVLKKLCQDNHINFDFLELEVTDRLRHKIKRIIKPALKAISSGGMQARKYLAKLESTIYKLKLVWLKHKMEHELESERKR